jgi:hypothetical protein
LGCGKDDVSRAVSAAALPHTLCNKTEAAFNRTRKRSAARLPTCAATRCKPSPASRLEDDDAEATTRGSATTARAASAPPAVAAVLTEHPSGYLAWFETLRAAAMVETPAPESAWFRAPIEHRRHMATTAPGAKDELKAIAGRVVVAVGNHAS